MSNQYRITTILCLLIIAISTSSWAQKKEQRGVLVENAEKGKSYLVLEGYHVKVFTKDSAKYDGVLGIKDSVTIKVDDEEINISDIDEFRGNDRKRIATGEVTMLVGAGLIGAAVVTFIVTGEIDQLTPLVKVMIVAGSLGIITTSAGAGAYADKRNYKSSKGWTFRVNGVKN